MVVKQINLINVINLMNHSIERDSAIPGTVAALRGGRREKRRKVPER